MSRRIAYPVALAAAALLCWSACGNSSRRGRRDADAPPSPAPPAAEPSVEHEVAPGDTLWRIAQAYDAGIEELRQANDMSRSEAAQLSPGQRIRIPGATEVRSTRTVPAGDAAAPDASTGDAGAPNRDATPHGDAAAAPPSGPGVWHELVTGESLWSLSRLYDVTLGALAEANSLSDDQARGLRPGARIFIPGARRARRTQPTPRAGSTTVQHELDDGETIWDLARLYQVSTAEIMAANGLTPRSVTRLRPGQRLRVPGVSQDGRGRLVQRRSRRQRLALRRAVRLGLGTRTAANALLNGRVRPEWTRAAGGSRFPGTLRWPITNGRFVRGYGSGEGGYHSAVDIAGDIGWNVRASAAGIVGFSGDSIRGYGNTVIVIHPGGWVTMYAHNSVNFVVAGERVREGTVLAEVGSTGISRGPHVHYEFKYAGQNCDPASLFRPGIRHRGGRVGRSGQTTWTSPRNRPEAVRCTARRRHPRSRWVTQERAEPTPAVDP